MAPTAEAEAPTTRRADNPIRIEKFDRLPIARIHPSKTNPRTHFDDAYIKDDLALSIADKGIIEPLVVRPHPKKDDDVEIVAGECRWRAAKVAGLELLPVIIREYSDEDVLEIQIEENTHRKDLTPLEEGAAYRRLININPDKHSAATIATRIGKSVTYVWDYLKLLDLIPEAKLLLERGKMAVGHAIVIARQKPADQARIINPNEKLLFQRLEHGLEFDGDTDPKQKPDKYDDVKPVTVRELEAAIAHHVRFDIAHAAKAVPLEFEAAAAKVEEAAAAPGRGKKVIAITFAHGPSDDAKDPSERTYGRQSWRLADGTKKSQPDGYGRPMKDSPTCEHSVMGVVVAGDEHYGRTFQVCVNRDKCLVHFGTEIAQREKNAKLRDTGKGKQAAKNEAKANEKQLQIQQENNRRREAWHALEPLLEADAIEQIKKIRTLTKKMADAIGEADMYGYLANELRGALGARWFKTPVAAWLVLVVKGTNSQNFDEFIKEVAKPLDLNVKRFEAIRDKHQPKAAAPAKKGAAA